MNNEEDIEENFKLELKAVEVKPMPSSILEYLHFIGMNVSIPSLVFRERRKTEFLWVYSKILHSIQFVKKAEYFLFLSKTIEVKILNGAKPEGTLLVVLFLFPSCWRTEEMECLSILFKILRWTLLEGNNFNTHWGQLQLGQHKVSGVGLFLSGLSAFNVIEMIIK